MNWFFRFDKILRKMLCLIQGVNNEIANNKLRIIHLQLQSALFAIALKVSMPYNMDPIYADTERTLVKNIEAYKEMGILDKNTDVTELMQKHWKPFDLD